MIGLPTQILLVAGVFLVASVSTAIYLWRRFERARMHGAIGAVGDQLERIDFVGSHLTKDDRWLIHQLRSNVQTHMVDNQLRTQMRELKKLAGDCSKDRVRFLRRLARCRRETNYHDLRRAFDDLTLAIYHLACVNSRSWITCLLEAKKSASNRLEKTLRILAPSGGASPAPATALVHS